VLSLLIFVAGLGVSESIDIKLMYFSTILSLERVLKECNINTGLI